MSSDHLDEHDARALRLSAAMNRPLYAPLRDVPLVITMQDDPADPPLYTPSQAMLWPSAVTLIALLCAAWAVALGLPWLYLNWARVVAALGAL